MAGGGSSELQALKDKIDRIIMDIESRIVALEKHVPVGDRPGGGVVSGGKDVSKSKKVSKKKPVGGAKKKKGK